MKVIAAISWCGGLWHCRGIDEDNAPATRVYGHRSGISEKLYSALGKPLGEPPEFMSDSYNHWIGARIKLGSGEKRLGPRASSVRRRLRNKRGIVEWTRKNIW